MMMMMIMMIIVIAIIIIITITITLHHSSFTIHPSLFLIHHHHLQLFTINEYHRYHCCYCLCRCYTHFVVSFSLSQTSLIRVENIAIPIVIMFFFLSSLSSNSRISGPIPLPQSGGW
jgi:hypothetical protein